MGELILFPTHENYCKECIFNNEKVGICNNPKYNENAYKVNCVWKHCKFKIKRLQQQEEKQ